MVDFKLDMEAVYSTMEILFLVEGYCIQHIMTDTRNDSGDDGGYMIVASKKDDLYNLHILAVNYNYDLSDIDLANEAMTFQTKQASIDAFNEIYLAMDRMDDDFGFEASGMGLDELKDIISDVAQGKSDDADDILIANVLTGHSDTMLEILIIVMSSYCEYKTHDNQKLKAFFETKYTKTPIL